MAELNSYCRHEANWATDCAVRLEKLGDVSIKSKFNFCSSPAILDTVVRVRQHLWKLSFSPKNARESKVIGLEYWPLRLHVNFFKDDATDAGSQTVLACLEAVKNEEGFCFMNATIPEQQLIGRSQYRPISSRYYDCDSTEISKATIPFFTIVCLVLSILLVATISCLVLWRRRVHRRRMTNRYHLTISGKCASRAPVLEQAKPYPQREVNEAMAEEEALMHSSANNGAAADERGRMQMTKCPDRLVTNDSKLVQTSFTSLLEASGMVTSVDDTVTSVASEWSHREK